MYGKKDILYVKELKYLQSIMDYLKIYDDFYRFYFDLQLKYISEFLKDVKMLLIND